MNQALHLFRLQKIDTQLDQVEARLSEIKKSLEADESIKQAEKLTAEAAKKLFQSKLALRECEEKVQAQRIKIETDESSLYGGKIRNPKELQDLQNEIQSLKKYLALLEDSQLEAMMALEETEKENQSALDFQAKTLAAFTNQKASLLGDQTQLIKNKERLIVEREVTQTPISQDNLDVYNRLRAQKRGVAVSSLSDGACTACGSILRPAEVQEARLQSHSAFCSNCGRIIYAG
jgi:uncharacterized protein